MKVLAHPLVRRADAFAVEAHGMQQQVRKGSDMPYIAHPRAVAVLVARHIDDPQAVAAALLHDVLEDTQTSKEQLVSIFGSVVADYVDELTKKAEAKLGNRRARAAHELARIAGISYIAKSIKCADLHDNVKSIVQVDPTFARVYVSEKAAQIVSLQGAHAELWTLAAESVAVAKHQLVEFANSRPTTGFGSLAAPRVGP